MHKIQLLNKFTIYIHVYDVVFFHSIFVTFMYMLSVMSSLTTPSGAKIYDNVMRWIRIYAFIFSFIDLKC